MPCWICETCGVQHADSSEPPARCPVCEDDRQYVGPRGQRWTTMEELREGRRNVLRDEEPGLTGIGTEPEFAIGQRALLVHTPAGNVLWDCVSLLDDDTQAAVERLGGIEAIAVSHPHFYSSVVEWAHAFGARVVLHADDARWIMRPDPVIERWTGESLPLLIGVTLHRLGGHFAGSTVLEWAAGAEGRGCLLTGDTITVAGDRRWVSWMYSFPNIVPLPPATVMRIASRVDGLEFDRIHGGWWGRTVERDAKHAVRRSAERYARAVEVGFGT
jgi:hypothetical protein